MVEVWTKSSTSGKGSCGAIYIACSVGGDASGDPVGRWGLFGSAHPFAKAVGDVGPAKHAMIMIRRTRQSFPPLYDRDISSGLCACA